MILQSCGFDREEVSRDLPPLPISVAATPFEIRLCTQASESVPSPAKELLAAGKEALLTLIMWSLAVSIKSVK